MAKSQAVDSIKNNPSTKTRITKLATTIFISILIFALLIGGLFWGYGRIYAQEFYPGVKIAGVDLGGQKQASADLLLKSKINNLAKENLKINVGDGTKQISLTDLGISINAKSTISEAYDYGRSGYIIQDTISKIKALFDGKDFKLKVDYNDATLAAKIKELAPNLYQEANNATFVVNDNTVTLQKEKEGKVVDLNNFKNDLNNLVDSNSASKTIILKTTVTEPSVASYQIENLQPAFEKIVTSGINFYDSESSKNYSASPEEIASWMNIKTDKNSYATLEINDNEIKSYIEQLAKKVNKKVIDKKINSQTKAVIAEGQDGLTLDESKLLIDIKQILAGRMDNVASSSEQTINLVMNVEEKGEKEIEPEEIKVNGGTPGLSEGRYLEINLSEQRMYLFEGTNQIASYVVSTGKWSMPTPIGTRYINSKDPRAWSEKYGLFMPYWNDIGGGYGIHELPEWPGGYKEGENHLGTPVSHGCIRLGVGAAEHVYNWAPIGTPVFIHR